MAQQLVYTSAPRLLQAGRTGFGTVAMHAGIPSWLQSEIEGFSQFSRLPGLDPSRVILSHAVFGQGDRKHHVFSRIQDCGADYTGRTNHIAHHFIFTAAEIVQATKLGVTPVDVLAFLSQGFWKTSWSGEPTILQADEELAIVSIPKNTLSLPAAAYWGHLCPEHPEYAAVLAPGKISEACWLIYPIGWSESIVYALGESMLLHTNPWIVTFTNNLQPTDNEQLFAWRCIPSDSPLIEKATASVRPCIDLSDPSPFLSGIPHEFMEQARTGKKPLPKARTIGATQPQTNPFSANSTSQIEKLPSAAQPLPSTPRPRIPLTRTTIKPHKQKKPTALIATLAIASLLLIGVLVIAYNNNKFKEKKDKILNEWAYVSQNRTFNTLTLNDQDLNSIKSFIGDLKKEQWDQVEGVIKALDKSSGNHNDINTSLQNTYQDKIVELRGKQYTKFSNTSNFSQEDLKRLSSLVQRSQEPKNEWNKAIELIKYLQNSSNTSDSSFKEEDLPMSVPEDKKVSGELFALYKKRIVKPPAEEPTNPPVVTATPKPTPTPEEKQSQPSPDAVTTGTKQPTIPNKDVPIYVFFKKPNDYGQLKPQVDEKFNALELTNSNILFNLDDAINKAGEPILNVQFTDDTTSFFVIKKNTLKHIALTDNQTFSKLGSALKDNEKEMFYEIKGETFSFRNDFLQLIKRIHDGQKFLDGETEKSAFTFTWELEVDPVSGKKYNFLNSNGTISSESLPQIQRNKIINELANLKEVLKPKKEKLQKLGQKYDKDFDCSDKSIETIIDNFISKFTQSKDKDFLILQNKINDIQTPNNSKTKKQTATGGDSQYKIITEIFKEKPKTMDQFLEYFNKWKEKQSVKTKLDDFKKEWNQIFVAEGIKWDEYEQTLIDLNRDAIKKEITEPHKDYMDAKQKVDSIESFNSQTTVPATLTINYLFESKNQEFLKLKIDNFPITPSEATGGQK
jgi:hypothetical protein